MQPAPSSSAPAVIYPAQNVLTLISRSWNLFRANFKNAMLMMMPPIMMLIVVNLVFGLLSSRTFLTPTTFQAMIYKLTAALVGLVLIVPTFFVWVYSTCALCRFYFSAIVGETPLSLKNCWAYVAKNWLSYAGLAIVLGLVSIALIAINFIILIAGIFLSTALIAALTTALPQLRSSLGSGFLPGLMLLMFLLIWGFFILGSVICMLTFQAFFFMFPLLAVSTTPTAKTDWWALIRHSYKLMFNHFPQLLVFSLALFFLSLTMMAVLMSPAGIWSYIELTRQGINQQDRIPMYIQMVLNIWGCMANLIMYPFHISAMTLFWYDCKVRKDGLDLRLWLNRLIRRHGQQPEEYHTVVDPQPV